MTETIYYKSLYEAVKEENLKLLEQNRELTKELEKYKARYLKRCTYEDEMQDIMEEVKVEKKWRTTGPTGTAGPMETTGPTGKNIKEDIKNLCNI